MFQLDLADFLSLTSLIEFISFFLSVIEFISRDEARGWPVVARAPTSVAPKPPAIGGSNNGAPTVVGGGGGTTGL